jgi:hypothetical protein
MEPYAFERTMDRLVERGKAKVDVTVITKDGEKSRPFKKTYTLNKNTMLQFSRPSSSSLTYAGGDTIMIVNSLGPERHPVSIELVNERLTPQDPNRCINTTFRRILDVHVWDL